MCTKQLAMFLVTDGHVQCALCNVQSAACKVQRALFLVAGVGSKARGEPVSGCQSLSSSHLQVRFSHLQARLGGVLDFERALQLSS